MIEPGTKIGSLRAGVDRLLRADDFHARLAEFAFLPARRVINPLFASLYSPDEVLKMRAVEAMGVVTAGLAERDMEAARVIMRRLMWNLNDESGGMGWGSPEAMGEIMAASDRVAREYAHVLVSYIREDGNFLEHDMLLRGVLWGLARLAEVRPHRLRGAELFIAPFTQSADPVLRGQAAKTLGLLKAASERPRLEALLQDGAQIRIFVAGKPTGCTVAELAHHALQLLDAPATEA